MNSALCLRNAHLAVLSLLAFGTSPLVAATPPALIEVREQLRARLAELPDVGIVVGVVSATETNLVTAGQAGGANPRPLDGDTLFEIGSATKVFTAILLADLVAQKDVGLTDPVAKLLPDDVRVPARDGKSITLRDLATHTSALPRMPDNFAPKDPGNPYADYTVERMYTFLGNYTLPRAIGEKYEYSNLGVGLLGHALARRAGTDYETLVMTRVCAPLGLTSTRIQLPPELLARLAPGHDAAGHAVKNWDLPTFAGAGALRSSVNDLLRFVAANAGLTESRLTPALLATHEPRASLGPTNQHIGLGWHLLQSHGTELVWHNGQTGGYHSYVGFVKQKKLGVVVLCNAALDIDDLGAHLLDPEFELHRVRQAVAVDPKIYAAFTGQYELVPGFVIAISPRDGRLFSRATGQGAIELFPESETNYFAKVVDAQISFDRDAQGRVTQLTLHQNGQHRPARKISNDVPKERQAVPVDPNLFDAYVGRYELAPNFILTVTRDPEHLFVQATGQPRFEVFPESTTKFFYQVVDAQISFVRDGSGKVGKLILHQGGDHTAKRIE